MTLLLEVLLNVCNLSDTNISTLLCLGADNIFLGNELFLGISLLALVGIMAYVGVR